MTVTTTNRKDTLTGDGVTLPFPFTFRVQSTDQIDVYIDDVIQASGYTPAINASGVGGTITFDVAPTNGAIVVIVRDVSSTQGTDFPSTGKFSDTAIENALDKLSMFCQQVAESVSRTFVLPITSLLSGELDTEGEAGEILRKNLTDDGYEFVSPAQAFVDSIPASGGGTIVGPVSSTARTIALWNNILGTSVKDGPALGTAGHGLRSGGASADPSFSAIGDVFRASGIVATLRTLPTSGALSGTYIHLGNWTSTGTLTFAHGTRIYIKGNMTLAHTLTGTAQSNGAPSVGKYAGHRGGGNGGGAGGNYVHTVSNQCGGGGGGGAGAGGASGSDVASGNVAGGAATTTYGVGGSGGGSGSGNATTFGQAGGNGGAFIYIEVDGNIVDNESTFADGVVGSIGIASGGAGGGGGGGQIVKRCTGTYALAASKSNSAVGGNGGATSTGHKGGGGGGGLIELWSGGAQTITGTNVVTGGTKGGGSSTQDASDGSAGTTTLLASVTPISLF